MCEFHLENTKEPASPWRTRIRLMLGVEREKGVFAAVQSDAGALGRDKAYLAAMEETSWRAGPELRGLVPGFLGSFGCMGLSAKRRQASAKPFDGHESPLSAMSATPTSAGPNVRRTL
ncbi:hypothetical protein B0H12DRAFT_1076795 [Mycena haematopus]|nr:hypothetical protein B0H12DRAFT_1076795 [Mycena haematopus]